MRCAKVIIMMIDVNVDKDAVSLYFNSEKVNLAVAFPVRENLLDCFVC